MSGIVEHALRAERAGKTAGYGFYSMFVSPRSRDPRVKVEVPHTDGCFNELCYLPGSNLYRRMGLGATERRDAIGRRHQHAGHDWLPLVCNDTRCHAVVLVRCDVLTDATTTALGVTK